MSQARPTTSRFQRHHIAAAIVAIVVAVALVLNYYLW
jgi:hypothetical protein